ncbi:hypothetical protein [Nonomuraea sp. LPB2021202275-12-8]|uniref:hypothetical protein n=1 Tax=Nonomuraea sp. LPB2021202275-12-8 TaxID=3120159 RepID=UPI00300C6FAB
MNALKISEGQRADALKISEKQQAEARQAKAATDLANETAFAQRVTLEPDDITSIILSGGTFTITNANTLSTEVQTRIWFSKAAGPDAYRMATFAAPACSQTTYRIGPTEREVLKVTDIDNLEDSSTLTSIAVYNPIGQRLWSTGMSGIPLKPEDLSEFGSMNSPLFENPTTRRALTGCV